MVQNQDCSIATLVDRQILLAFHDPALKLPM